MFYEIEVRPGPGSDFFQYYTEVVEAPTSHDAEKKIQRANPGCIVRTTKSWNEYEDDSSSKSDGPSAGGLLVLVILGFFVFAWKYILVISAIALGLWIAVKAYNHSK